MSYEIVVHELAVEELEPLRAFDRRRVLAEIREQLTNEPTLATRRRKCLLDLSPSFDHELPVWELRVGVFRVFYDVNENERRTPGRPTQSPSTENGGYCMKPIPSRELQTNVDAVLNSSQNEHIVIYREGKPCAVLVGIQDYDAEDLQLASSPDFWHMIRQRRASGIAIPLADVEARFETRQKKPSRERTANRKPPRKLK